MLPSLADHVRLPGAANQIPYP